MKRMMSAGFMGLVVIFSAIFVAPVSAVTMGTGLTGSVGRPGTQWSSSLTANPGETINVLISYTNSNQTSQKYVTITNALPQGATFNATSAYLYTPDAPHGVQQPDTLTTSGIKTGTLKPGESASIQFQMTLPSAKKLPCGTSTLVNTVNAVSRNGGKAYAAVNNVTVVNKCPVATSPATTTPTTAATNTQPTVTTATTTTVPSPSNNTPTTAPNVTKPAETVAAKNDTNSSSKTLVKTGAASALTIFVAASIAGLTVHRYALRKFYT